MHLYLYKHMDEFTATLDIWRILPTNYYTLYYTLIIDWKSSDHVGHFSV